MLKIRSFLFYFFLVFKKIFYIKNLSLCLFHSKTALKLVRTVDIEYSECKIEHYHQQIFVISVFRRQKQDRTNLEHYLPTLLATATTINTISIFSHQHYHHTPSSTPSTSTATNIISMHRHQHHQHTLSSTSSYTVINTISMHVINISIHSHQHHHMPCHQQQHHTSS